MWKKLSFPVIYQTRTYVPRRGNNLVGFRNATKTLQGKIKTTPIQSLQSSHLDDDLDPRLSKKEIKTSQEYLDDPEGFGDFESDFMETHKSHQQFQHESKKQREQIHRWIAKKKYFKEKLPNFLTYAEKEQIKLLNSRDPDEWTTEKLSESFPATPEIIAKIIKAKWTANSEERIKSHDKLVMKNWSLFKDGKFRNSLNKTFLEHLQKFANRTLEDLKNVNNFERNFPKLPVPKTTEFLDIIRSCKKYTEKKRIEDAGEKNEKIIEMKSSFPSPTTMAEKSNDDNDETFLIGKIFDKRKMRLKDLKNEKLIPEKVDEMPTNLNEKSESADDVLKVIQENALEKLKTTEIEISREDMKKYEVSTIKERIHIPRKLWKKGSTYKVEDCYYDDDGMFLYRVPGMTGRKV